LKKLGHTVEKNAKNIANVIKRIADINAMQDSFA
jgi:hypothetical protein